MNKIYVQILDETSYDVHVDSSYISDNENPPQRIYTYNPCKTNVTTSSEGKGKTRRYNKIGSNFLL